MGEVADSYIRLGATLREGIQGLGQRAKEQAQMGLDETRMRAQLEDPRREVEQERARDELTRRKSDFHISEIAGDDPYDQLHVQKNILPKIGEKLGWRGNPKDPDDGNLYKPDGSKVNRQDFYRAGSQILFKTYSDPVKNIENKMLSTQQQLSSLDPNNPEHVTIGKELQKRTLMLNQAHKEMVDNPYKLAAMKYERVLNLASQTPDPSDYRSELRLLNHQMTQAAEKEIRSGKRRAEDYFKVSMYRKDEDGSTDVVQTYIPKVREDGTPNTWDDNNPYFQKYRKMGYARGLPGEIEAQRGQTMNQRYGAVERFYNRQVSDLQTALKSQAVTTKQYESFMTNYARAEKSERWRISQGRPTALERGIELDSYGFFEGEVAKGRDGKEYRYEGNDTWVPLGEGGWYKRSKAGRFESQSQPLGSPQDAI